MCDEQVRANKVKDWQGLNWFGDELRQWTDHHVLLYTEEYQGTVTSLLRQATKIGVSLHK